MKVLDLIDVEVVSGSVSYLNLLFETDALRAFYSEASVQTSHMNESQQSFLKACHWMIPRINLLLKTCHASAPYHVTKLDILFS